MGATTPVYATDSRGYLLSLDASAASLLTPAKTSWSLSNATEPTGFDITGDATAEIFAWHANALNVLDANTGIALKSFSVLTANNQAPLGDIMATDLNADGHPDLLYQIFNGGSGNVETYAVDYTSGASLWAAPYLGVEAGCWEPGLSFAPNATGAPDLVTSNCSEAVQLAAGTGAMKAHTNTLWGSFLISFDANSDGTPELYSTGTRAYTGAFDHALTPSWTLTSTMPAGQHYAAVAHCSDGTARYAGTREDQPIFFVLDAATGAQLNGTAAQPGVILAGGASFASLDAAVASGKFPGVLGNVTAVANLHGANTPAFLLGSTDGFLYAFDACAGTMLWALNLRWAVGQPILADVRNNGQEQIVVSVGDGYLYGIDQEVFPAPVSVRDVDPLSGKPNTEVPDIDTLDTLYVAWDLVPGATSYECAVIDPSGTIITAHGDFIDCGNGSSASIAGLVLHDGAVYQQAVRALGAPGASIESFSPGVTVHVKNPMNGDALTSPHDGGTPVDGTGRGCGCHVAGRSHASSPAMLFLVLTLAVLVARRRYARTRPSGHHGRT